MADTKTAVLEMLRELAELTMLDEGDPQSFRVRAYESAAQAVSNHGGDLAQLDATELRKISGIGKSTAEKIRELVETGRVDKLERLRRKHPPEVVALTRIPGVGPKGLARLRQELGVESLAQLRKALDEHRLRGLKGFGPRSEEKLRQALDRLDARGELGRTPIARALPLATELVERVRAVDGVQFAGYCGSLRRFSETVGDIDIVVSAAEAGPVMGLVTSLGLVDHVLAEGDAKTSIVTRHGIQVDVRVVQPHQLGAALVYFTGSKGHNIKLRQRALARGLTLNEYALSRLDGGEVVASETEEAVYAALDLPFIPPILREDWGEIDAAEQGTLPAALGPVRGDFHVHTELSGDAKSPLGELVEQALARGYHTLAITDHAEGAAMVGVGREALLSQRAAIGELRAKLGDRLALLHGVELNIGPAGELDYDAEFRAGFDFCLASVHSHYDLDRDAQTRRIVTAMRDPSVRMIGHLTAREIGRRPPIDLDLEAVLEAAEATGTALEVNGSLSRLDAPVEVMRAARDRDVPFILTSDAHRVGGLDAIGHARTYAERAGMPRARVANVWEADAFRAWLRREG